MIAFLFALLTWLAHLAPLGAPSPHAAAPSPHVVVGRATVAPHGGPSGWPVRFGPIRNAAAGARVGSGYRGSTPQAPVPPSRPAVPPPVPPVPCPAHPQMSDDPAYATCPPAPVPVPVVCPAHPQMSDDPAYANCPR